MPTIFLGGIRNKKITPSFRVGYSDRQLLGNFEAEFEASLEGGLVVNIQKNVDGCQLSKTEHLGI